MTVACARYDSRLLLLTSLGVTSRFCQSMVPGTIPYILCVSVCSVRHLVVGRTYCIFSFFRDSESRFGFLVSS